MTVSYLRYAEAVRRALLAAGVDGISQYHLNQKVRTRHFNANHLDELLLDWKIKHWVDKFYDPHNSKRPVTIWRATELLKTEWPKITVNLKGPLHG